jgi:hypothetical protein
MIRTLTGILAGAVCMMLAGCGAQGEEYQPKPVPAEKSVVYIYRPYKVFGSGAAPMVTCGHESIEMEPGGYYAFEQESGPVTCTAATEAKLEYKFDARPGEQYFIKEDVDAATQGGRTHFTMMDAAVASEEIKDCRRQGIKQ